MTRLCLNEPSMRRNYLKSLRFDLVPVILMYKQVNVSGPDWKNYYIDGLRFRQRISLAEKLLQPVLLKKLSRINFECCNKKSDCNNTKFEC